MELFKNAITGKMGNGLEILKFCITEGLKDFFALV